MSMIYYSFVTKKNVVTKDKQLELLERRISIDSATNAAIKLKVLKIGLTANNKFYCDFGEKSPFHFFKCYPVLSDSDTLVVSTSKDSGTSEDSTTSTDDNKTVLANYVHPTGWGLCEVIESNVEGCVVGSVFRGMVPFGTHVQFEKASYPIKDNDNTDAEKQSTILTITSRPDVFPAYNQFVPVSINSVEHPASIASIAASADKEVVSSIALTSFPGILTGFCLYHHLDINKYYGDCSTVVITSASSKVALAFALSCKENKCTKKIIGVTSDSNKVFVESTKLYDQVITYTDVIPVADDKDKPYVIMIDISGQGNFYKVNENKICKLLAIGNSSDTVEKESTFSSFTIIATIKMIASMMPFIPSFVVNAITTKQELYLVFTTLSALTKLWGPVTYENKIVEFTNTFCNTAISDWNFNACTCTTEQDIQTKFTNIVQGTVVPNECIVFDVNKAIEHRISST